MSRELTCRKCGKAFSALPEEENITWMMRSQGYYYHVSCWEEFLNVRMDKNDAEWKDLSYYLITHLMKSSYNFHQVERQFLNFQNEGMTAKGIYYTLYWHFIIRDNEWKPQFGIGLVPHIYKEATEYWYDQEFKRQGIIEQIERNSRENSEKARMIKQRPRKEGGRLKEIDAPF